MCDLSKREKQILDELLEGALPEVVAMRLNVTKEAIGVYKTRVRRKIAKAKALIAKMRKYDEVLYPKRQYKGVS